MANKGAMRESGSRFLRQNLILSTLSGRPLEVSGIRPTGLRLGLQPHEGNLLKLIDRITNGCRVEISGTGTELLYRPGFIIGGQVTHECSPERGLGYWLEVLCCLAPFAKNPTEATLIGVTNFEADVGVDAIRTVTLPLLRRFGVEASLKVIRRGAAPLGGGRVVFTCAPVRKLEAVNLVREGKVSRVRGVAYSAKVSPDLATRLMRGAKGLLLELLPDVFVTVDHFRGEEAGLSPGYGITLVAETTNKGDVFMSEEVVPDPAAMAAAQLSPEDMGALAAKRLLDQLCAGGAVDHAHQALALLFMALGPEQHIKILMGRLTPYGENMRRLIEEYFGVAFTLQPQVRPGVPSSVPPRVLVACIGHTLINIAKRSA
jgi:RNA 3'-terminal phosphate cyclase-like protein